MFGLDATIEAASPGDGVFKKWRIAGKQLINST
jgi:hypothetical protein